MRQANLPPKLAAKWGHLRYLHQVSPTEVKGECPRCGELGHDPSTGWPDRFVIFLDDHPRAFCRRCGHFEWADEGDPNFKVTPDMQAAWLAERIERERLAQQRIEETLALLERERVWLTYHESLNEEGMMWWDAQGVPGEIVSLLYLGWCENRTFWSNDVKFSTPTATIPVFSPGWKIQTVRHRLIRPVDEGRYRPDRAGLPASLYYANPDREPAGHCLIVEGEKKAIVTAHRLGIYDGRDDLCVVGTPGKQIKFDMLKTVVDKCEWLTIALDPDAHKQSWDLARWIGDKASVVYLPAKADDFFTQYGGSREDFEAMLRYARQE